MKLKNSKTKVISILMLIILIFNFMTPLKSDGFFTSILTKPIATLYVWVLDGINRIGSVLFVSEADYTALEEGMENKDASKDSDDAKIARYNKLMSPDKIFSGEVGLLNADIFAAPNEQKGFYESITDDTNDAMVGGIGTQLKKSASGVYTTLRNICAVIMLCLLIYTGIRILITSASPYRQAEWKKILLDWVKAICLLIFMHYLMIGIFYFSDLLVAALKQSWGDQSIVSIIRARFDDTSFLDGSACIIYMIMYGYITFLTIAFFISYFKRLIWIVILIIISPSGLIKKNDGVMV